MTKFEQGCLVIFVHEMKQCLDEIDDGRYIFSSDFGFGEDKDKNKVKFTILDKKLDIQKIEYFRWYILKNKNKSIIYPFCIIAWINNTISEFEK